jgi:hypothetical protein
MDLLLLRNLSQGQFELHVAGQSASPALAFDKLRAIPGVALRPTNFGPSVWRRSKLQKLAIVAGAVPAAASLLGLAVYIWRHRIEILHSTDRPRDAIACVVLAIWTWRLLQASRFASRRWSRCRPRSRSHCRPRAIALTSLARLSELIGRPSVGDEPSGTTIAPVTLPGATTTQTILSGRSLSSCCFPASSSPSREARACSAVAFDGPFGELQQKASAAVTRRSIPSSRMVTSRPSTDS